MTRPLIGHHRTAPIAARLGLIAQRHRFDWLAVTHVPPSLNAVSITTAITKGHDVIILNSIKVSYAIVSHGILPSPICILSNFSTKLSFKPFFIGQPAILKLAISGQICHCEQNKSKPHSTRLL